MMHKLTRGGILALALFAVTLSASVASAAWIPEQLRWQRSNATEGLYFKSYITTGAAAKVDTTEAFDLDECDFPPLTIGSAGTTLDTVIVAKLVIYGDSTVASTISFKSTAVKFQMNAGTSSAGWEDLRTVSTLNTDGVKSLEVPIYLSNNAVSKQLYIDATGDYSMFGRSIRAIVTQTGATAIPTMKVKLVKYRK